MNVAAFEDVGAAGRDKRAVAFAGAHDPAAVRGLFGGVLYRSVVAVPGGIDVDFKSICACRKVLGHRNNIAVLRCAERVCRAPVVEGAL